MNRYSFTMNGYTFTRINRTKARAAYENGLAVLACPCNLRPGSLWHPEAILDPRTADLGDFDMQESWFALWNCVDGETGKRPAYYIPVRTFDRFTGEPCPADRPGAVELYDYDFMKGGEERV